MKTVLENGEWYDVPNNCPTYECPDCTSDEPVLHIVDGHKTRGVPHERGGGVLRP